MATENRFKIIKKRRNFVKQVAELEVTDNKKLVLSIGEFRGVERVDLRQYIKVKEEFLRNILIPYDSKISKRKSDKLSNIVTIIVRTHF